MSAHKLPREWLSAPWNVADPGDAGTLNLDNKGFAVCEITTAAAETRTIPAPEQDGQMVLCCLDTDAGDCTITVTGGNGVSSIVLDDAGDAICLMAVTVAGTAKWKVAWFTGVGDSILANDITGTDSSLGIAGQAAAQGGAVAIVGGVSSTSSNAGGAVSMIGAIGTTTAVGGKATVRGGAGTGAAVGGEAVLEGGLGGSSTTVGVGGAATVTAGAGQATAAGGIASLVGGASGAGATGAGGEAKVTGGAAASTNGAGGAVTITGGIGLGTGAGGAVATVGALGGTTGAGGDVTHVAGAGTGTGAGGNVTLTGGRGGATSGAAGTAIVTAGAGGATPATTTGGIARLIAGAGGAGATGNGGNAEVTGGASLATNGSGGAVIITPGALTGTGVNGGLHLRSPTGLIFDQQTAATTAIADGNWAPTVAEFINGILSGDVTTGRTLTTPTGAQLSTACGIGLAVGDSFNVYVSLIGSAGADDILTMTAGDGNVTFIGTVTLGPIVAGTAPGAATWRFRNTGTNTWVGYRIS